jgi:hypothetical protein
MLHNKQDLLQQRVSSWNIELTFLRNSVGEGFSLLGVKWTGMRQSTQLLLVPSLRVHMQCIYVSCDRVVSTVLYLEESPKLRN